MKVSREPSDRQKELLLKLEMRAKECPGLYPIKTGEDFRRVAMDYVGGEDEAVCRVLEAMWHRPDEAVQLNAQSLIGRGHGLVGQEEEKRKAGAAPRQG
jgi:hypothetical protein